VRVGSVTQAAGHEKTYRIFVKELPPVDGAAGGGVRVLTTMGIPIFVRPEKEIATAALNELRQGGGQLQFALANTGTVHFIPQQITVRGLADGIEVFEKQIEGWYVLAGGRRDFGVAVPPEQCGKVTALRVHVEFASATLEEDLRTPGGACSR
jgi:P pilus assembly chaperone PapD